MSYNTGSAAVFNSKDDTNWSIVGYSFEQKQIVEDGSGSGGLSEMIKSFDESKIQWGVIQVVGVDQQNTVTSNRPKFIRIDWIGQKVSPMKKRVSLQESSNIAELYQGVAVSVQVNKASEITTQVIGRKLLDCGGAHKPTYYDFGGDERIDIGDIKV
jgi:hypothetical protein